MPARRPRGEKKTGLESPEVRVALYIIIKTTEAAIQPLLT
jgi:hypothetical protein